MNTALDKVFEKGVKAHEAGELEGADSYFRAVLEIDQRHRDANFFLGLINVETKHLRESLSFFEVALEVDSGIDQFWISYIDVLLKLGRLSDAKGMLKKARKRGMSGEIFDEMERLADESHLLSQAQQQLLSELYGQGRYQEVFDQTKTLLQKIPNSEVLYNMHGVVSMDLGKIDNAIDSYKQAIRIDPNFTSAYYNMGVAFQGKFELDKAIESYREALRIKPDYAEPLNNMANIFRERGELDKAIDTYQQAIEININYSDAYNNMGAALLENAELDKALESLQRALEIDPEDARAHMNMGNVFQKKGKVEAAIGHYKNALKIKPDYFEAYINIGVALEEIGELDEAIGSYKKALEIKPDYAEARYNLGIALTMVRKYEEAVECFRSTNYGLSQCHLLQCLYILDWQSEFYNVLDLLIEEKKYSSVIGSLCSRAEITYGRERVNLFCKDPMNYVRTIDLSTEHDFEEGFVKVSKTIINEKRIDSREQPLLANGFQTTGNLFSIQKELTRDIEKTIRHEVEKYRLHFENSKEGLITRWPDEYSLYGWLVSMKSGGALSPHMHENGWLSGSVYINVPTKIKADDGSLVVCIDDDRSLEDKSKNPKKIIGVKTGNLVLFPSSLFHYTIPFESEEERIVLAFDVIPKLENFSHDRSAG